MYATAILRELFESMNSDLSQYIIIHHKGCSGTKIRKEYAYIRSIYTIDHFPIYYHIHHQQSPSTLRI